MISLPPSKITEQHIPCPSCPSSDAYCVYDDGHGFCFSCEYYKPRTLDLNDYTYEYLSTRGIYGDTFKFFDAKTKIDAAGKPVAIRFNYPNGAYKIRTLEEKGFYTEGDIAKAGLFGRNKFGPGSNRSITVTEGELDALSLYQILKSPVVSVRSSTSAKLDCAIDRSYLNSFERIYLAFDADEPGRSAASDVAKLFDYNKVYDVRFGGGIRKDANDYLRAGEESELRNIWWNAKKFLPDNLMSSVSDFEKELLRPVKYGVSYPFPTLTNMTYGLRTGEVVLITAQEGVGKTEVMHTILHHLLKETDDAIGAIFLEESKQRLLQAIAGIELQRPVHLPDSGVQPSDVVGALKSVVPTDDRLYVYNHFGSDSADSILDTIRFLVTARGCRWIAFDLISLAITGLGGDREREALEYLSARLEILTQELDFGLIMVSHVNDFGQTRGSRMISKNCHVRIDLKRDVENTSDRLRRTTNLIVSKNRPASMTGPAGNLLFNPVTHTLSEDYGEIVDEEIFASA